jgi:hypothetical protein
MSNSSEWNLSTGPRIVDPSREPVFDITADGKIVEVNDATHGEDIWGSHWCACPTQKKKEKLGIFLIFLWSSGTECGGCVWCVCDC